MSELTSGTISIVPSSGTNTSTLTISASATTKRGSKSLEVFARGTGAYSDVQGSNTLYVTQDGLGNKVELSGSNLEYSGGTATLSGSCNLEVITLANKDGETNNLLQYLGAAANSATIKIGNNAPIDITTDLLSSSHSYTPSNDPGADAPYTLTLNFSGIPSNTGSSSKEWHIMIGGVDTVLVQDAASTITITFTSTNPGDETGGNIGVNFNADGTGGALGTIKVTTSDSSVSWEIVEVQ